MAEFIALDERHCHSSTDQAIDTGVMWLLVAFLLCSLIS